MPNSPERYATKRESIEAAIREQLRAAPFVHFALVAIARHLATARSYPSLVYGQMRREDPALPRPSRDPNGGVVFRSQNPPRQDIPREPTTIDYTFRTLKPSGRPDDTRTRFLEFINRLQPQNGAPVNLAKIARELGVSRQRAYQLYAELMNKYPKLPPASGIIRSNSRETLKPSELEVLKLRRANCPRKLIAEITGISVGHVDNIIQHLKEIGLIPPNKPLLKDRPLYSRIVELRKLGVGETQIVTELRVDPSVVKGVCNQLRKRGEIPPLRARRQFHPSKV